MPVSLVSWVHHFGVVGVALGAALEGETAVLIGGVVSRHGAFSPYAAAIAACLGSFLADQFFFGLGRWRRNGRLVQRVAQKPAFMRGLKFIDDHPAVFCAAFRFVYGFRVAGPVAIGVSQVPVRLFVALNLLSAAIWACTFTILGFHYGRPAERILRQLLTPSHLAVVAALIVMAVIGLIAYRQLYKIPRKAEDSAIAK